MGNETSLPGPAAGTRVRSSMEKGIKRPDLDGPPQRKERNAGNAPLRSRPVFRHIRVAGLALVLPFIMGVGPVVGYLAGDWIGRQAGYVGWGRLIGLLAGAVASAHQTILIIRRLMQELK